MGQGNDGKGGGRRRPVGQEVVDDGQAERGGDKNPTVRWSTGKRGSNVGKQGIGGGRGTVGGGGVSKVAWGVGRRREEGGRRRRAALPFGKNKARKDRAARKGCGFCRERGRD